MKRSEFLLRLAVENKFGIVSETVDVVQLPDNNLDLCERSESCSSMSSISPPLHSSNLDSSLQNSNENFVGGTVITDTEKSVIKPSYENCSETITQCGQKNSVESSITNIDLALPQTNHSYASSTIIKESLHCTSAQKSCLPESYSSDLEIQEMPLSETFIDKLSTSSINKHVNIISNIILKPGTSGETSRETTSAHNTSNLTSTIRIGYDIYNFCDEESDIETENTKTFGPAVLNNNKNLTLLAPLSLKQDFFENSSHLVTSTENTDGFNILSEETDCYPTQPKNRTISLLENDLVMEPSTFLQEIDNIMPSDCDDVFESSGDEYELPTDDSDDDDNYTSSDGESEICIGDVQRTYSKNSKENINTMNYMTEEVQTDCKDTLQKNSQSFDLYPNKLGTKLPKQMESTEETNTDIYNEISSVTNQTYTKKQSARERPTICPLCYEDVITHFPRHLSRHHAKDPEVKRMLTLKPKSKERLELVSNFRKRGNFILKTEKGISHPVKSSRDADTDHFVCTFCLGLYNKKMLYRHVKICKSKPPDITNPGKNCQGKSQLFMASKNHEFLRTSRLRNEVFETMRADSVSKVAQSDPLICLYGEVLLAKHKRQQIVTLVSNKIREMARMLMAISSMHDNIRGLFDVLKPEMFATLVAAAKIISGYNEAEKSFRAPSLALHMGTNLKIICNIGFKIVIERKQIPNISWEDRDTKKRDIKDLSKLIESHWCHEISSLALKELKERQWQKPTRLPLTEDIVLFQKYIEEISENAHDRIKNGINVKDNYKKLTECVLAQTIMFNRKRVGDVQYLKIQTYENENTSTNQKAFAESLTDFEKILCRKFKRVITDGKGSKPVPILFSKRSQTYIKTLLNIRKMTNIVPESNSYLFANPGVKNKWMRGDYVIRMFAKKCGANQPLLLTSTKFRKHIATTLQLMNMGPDEMEQVATFMGHTKKTHAQFYRLPQDVYQTAKVVKVLLLLEKGKGKEFRGKNLEEISLDEDYCDVSDAEDTKVTKEIGEEICKMDDSGEILGANDTKYDIKNVSQKPTKIETKDKEVGGMEGEEKIKDNDTEILEKKTTKVLKKDNGTSRLKPIVGRSRWTSAEKILVEKYFENHIKKKITPKKYECDQFLSEYGDKMIIKDWIKIKTFVYNTFRHI